MTCRFCVQNAKASKCSSLLLHDTIAKEKCTHIPKLMEQYVFTCHAVIMSQDILAQNNAGKQTPKICLTLIIKKLLISYPMETLDYLGPNLQS